MFKNNKKWKKSKSKKDKIRKKEVQKKCQAGEKSGEKMTN